ncbi:MAG: hypothetical protein GWO24_19760, partial [Akkermansiaceae bacterium]|nr:hypothetical protein [Akkermansiaceae bacterium]
AMVGGLVFNFGAGAREALSGESPPMTHGIVSSLLVALMAVIVFEICHGRVARRNGHVLLVFSGMAAHLALVRLVAVLVEVNHLDDQFGASFALLL